MRHFSDSMFSWKATAVVLVFGVIIYFILHSDKLPVQVHGTVEPGFELVEQAFRRNFENGLEQYGNAFSVYHNNRLVVDLWGGYADKESEYPWQQDTMSVFWSTTKSVAALCVSILVDRGVVKYEDLVTKHWPEFGKHGKGNVTIEMMLSHQAGMPCIDAEVTTEIVNDLKKLCKIIEDQKPQLPPGRGFAYHTVTHGYLISCLFPRIDPRRRTVGSFFKEEVADKFGIDFHIGLPKELHYRIARLSKQTMTFTNLQFLPETLFAMIGRKGAIARRTVFEQKPLFLMHPELLNSWAFQSAELAAIGGIGTARSQSKLYNILLNQGTADGITLISSKTLKKAMEQVTSGQDQNFQVRSVNLQFTRGGFCLTDFDGLGRSFGSFGYGRQLGFLNKRYNVTFGFLTNGINGFGMMWDARTSNLLDALHKSLENINR